jgi:hypothetical protein
VPVSQTSSKVLPPCFRSLQKPAISALITIRPVSAGIPILAHYAFSRLYLFGELGVISRQFNAILRFYPGAGCGY